MRYAALFLTLVGLTAASSAVPVTSPGAYRDAAGHVVFVGVSHVLSDAAVNETFDPATNRLGASTAELRLATAIDEYGRMLDTPNGALGVSLYSIDTKRRPTVILIHGNDPETREMGFVIPYFVAQGVNVISYDQRGTGSSSGDWFLSGPEQRAVDVEAVFDAFATDSRVDPRRLGIWAVSNGGWTAPIVATQRPVAFLLLKSPPAESVRDNLRFEIRQRMQHHRYGEPAIFGATDLWNSAFAALDGNGSWDGFASRYRSAATEKWFPDSAMPAHLPFPLPQRLIEGFRNAVDYDPAAALSRVRTPTIAFFCTLDRSVDVAHAAPAFRHAYSQNATDYTDHVSSDCGHSLLVSSTGFGGEASRPMHYTTGYPVGMLDWLRARHLTSAATRLP